MSIGLADVICELVEMGPGIPEYDNENPAPWNRYLALTKIRGQLAAQVAMTGTKLRILPQSQDVRRGVTAALERRIEDQEIKPWQDNVN